MQKPEQSEDYFRPSVENRSIKRLKFYEVFSFFTIVILESSFTRRPERFRENDVILYCLFLELYRWHYIVDLARVARVMVSAN